MSLLIRLISLFVPLLCGNLSALPCPEPNETCLDALIENWLRVNPTVERQVYVHAHGEPNEPNGLERTYVKFVIKSWQFHPLTIMDLNVKPDGIVNLADFAVLSACWTGAVRTAKTEPNTALGTICYTVGGKHHMYDSCRYIVNKEWVPCVCDPNNYCLTCFARYLKETEQ